jgi:hypothetical protein
MPRSNHDPFDFIEGEFVAPAIVGRVMRVEIAAK